LTISESVANEHLEERYKLRDAISSAEGPTKNIAFHKRRSTLLNGVVADFLSEITVKFPKQ
jgi:hypothetical protein